MPTTFLNTTFYRVREINPALKSFDDWLSENASKFESN